MHQKFPNRTVFVSVETRYDNSITCIKNPVVVMGTARKQQRPDPHYTYIRGPGYKN